MLGNKGSKKNYRDGGSRGGQNQFNWEDVKHDKHRENYLGHSVSAAVGKWQKGRDIAWYTKAPTGSKESESNKLLEDEKRRMIELERELMDEELGIKPKKNRFVDGQLDSFDLRKLSAKSGIEREEMDTERIKGLGQGPVKFHEHIERETLVGKEIKKLQDVLVNGNTNEAFREAHSSKLNSRIIDPSLTKKNNQESGSKDARSSGGDKVNDKVNDDSDDEDDRDKDDKDDKCDEEERKRRKRERKEKKREKRERKEREKQEKRDKKEKRKREKEEESEGK